MTSRTTQAFRDQLGKLPALVRRQARAAYRQFASDPQHPGLRFKKVHSTLPIYSARVSGDCRAVGVLERNELVWFWIGSHADYDKLLKGL